MDALSNSELLQLIVSQRQNVDAQFEFWLTITFAFIVAIFASKNRLPVQLKLFASILYLVATASLIGRSGIDGFELAVHLREALDRGLIPDPPVWPTIARGVLVVLGTFGSIYFVFRIDSLEN